MEKISRIIPPNARTSSYDPARAQPGRPGSPQLGRPQSFEPVTDRVSLSERMTNSVEDVQSHLLPKSNSKLASSQYKSTDNVKSQVVKQMTDNFFMKNQAPKSEEVASRSIESTESRVSPESSKELSL